MIGGTANQYVSAGKDKSARRKAAGALKPNVIRLKRGTEAGPLFRF